MNEKLKASIKVKCPPGNLVWYISKTGQLVWPNKSNIKSPVGKETLVTGNETRGSISINGEEKEQFTLRFGEEKTLEVEFAVDDGDHNLTIENLYTPNLESAIIIDSIVLDDIDLGVILYKGEYTPTYPEPWYTDETNAGRPPKSIIGGADGHTDSDDPLSMGWLGTYSLKFSTPLYKWLLDREYTFTVPATGSTFTLVSTSNQQFKLRILTPYTNGRTSMLIYKQLYLKSLEMHRVLSKAHEPDEIEVLIRNLPTDR